MHQNHFMFERIHDWKTICFWHNACVRDFSFLLNAGILGDGRCLFRSVIHGAWLRSGKQSPSESCQKDLADELREKVYFYSILLFYMKHQFVFSCNCYRWVCRNLNFHFVLAADVFVALTSYWHIYSALGNFVSMQSIFTSFCFNFVLALNQQVQLPFLLLWTFFSLK